MIISHHSSQAGPFLQRSFWMREAEPALQASAPLTGSQAADIVIIGGGYVGLWTALSIKELSPHSKVVVLERDVCGGGASGRNGGMAMSWWPKIASLLAFADVDDALFLARARNAPSMKSHSSAAAIASMRTFAAGDGSGRPLPMRSRSHGRARVQACARVGARPFEHMLPEDVARRTGSRMHRAGVFERGNATVQPARLVRGMRRVALERGIVIHENTPVLELSHGYPAVIRSASGTILAKSVVLATNAWAAAIPEISRLIVPVNSSIVVTQAIPERLAALGWTGGEAITDSQLMVGYYRTTRDGRIAYGKGTGALSRGGVIDATFSRHEESCLMAEQDFRRATDACRRARLACVVGPIDRTYDSLPVFGTLAGTGHIHYGVGWSGNGVAPSLLGGRILASLALDRNDVWRRCALVDRKTKRFPPEPIKYFGGSLVRNAVRRKEEREARDLAPRWLDVLLAGFAPAGLED